MWGHPGKKLLFMGAELGQEREWNHDGQLDWDSLGDPLHSGLQSLVRDLNQAYRQTAALYANDNDPSGFSWVIGDDQNNSVLAFLRHHNQKKVLIVSNFTPVPRYDYRVGVPVGGQWLERLNTDAAFYGGSNAGNGGSIMTGNLPAHGHPYSLSLTLPPLATLVLQPQG
jgi:1,4-alpha-glucan branching enzyme